MTKDAVDIKQRRENRNPEHNFILQFLFVTPTFVSSFFFSQFPVSNPSELKSKNRVFKKALLEKDLLVSKEVLYSLPCKATLLYQSLILVLFTYSDVVDTHTTLQRTASLPQLANYQHCLRMITSSTTLLPRTKILPLMQ